MRALVMFMFPIKAQQAFKEAGGGSPQTGNQSSYSCGIQYSTTASSKRTTNNSSYWNTPGKTPVSFTSKHSW